MTLPATDLTSVETGDSPDSLPTKRRRFRFIANRKAAAGLGIIVFFVIFAIIGPWIAPYNPDKRGSDLVQAPSMHHWSGTTHLGQDVFSQLLVGTRAVVYIGFFAALIAVALSIVIGVTAGYIGGVVDEVLSAVTNVFLVIPGILLIIIICVTVPKVTNTVIAIVIGITSWAWGARVLRAQTLSLRRRDYVEAARATGETSWRIIMFEIMPNLSAIIASGFISTAVYAVASEITLAFIGVSGQSGWNWGTILYWAVNQSALQRGAWWWFIPASMAIALFGCGLALLNFGIDEFISPRLRSAGKATVRTSKGRKVRMRVGFTPVLGTPVLSTPLGAAVPDHAVSAARPGAPETLGHTDGDKAGDVR